MTPEQVKQFIDMLTNYAQPLWNATYRYVLIANVVSTIVAMAVLILTVYGMVVSLRKYRVAEANNSYIDDWTGMLTCISGGASIVAMLTLIFSVVNLLNLDFVTFQTIKGMIVK